jgi:hypothetical protein
MVKRQRAKQVNIKILTEQELIQNTIIIKYVIMDWLKAVSIQVTGTGENIKSTLQKA